MRSHEPCADDRAGCNSKQQGQADRERENLRRHDREAKWGAIDSLIMRVHEPRRRGADRRADSASEKRDQRGFEHDRPEHGPPRHAEQAEGGDVPSSLLDLEQHDAQQKDRAREDGDDPDGPMEPAHDLERARRLDRDVRGAMRAKAEGRGVDPVQRIRRRAGACRGEREAIDPIPVSDQCLEMSEVHPHPVLRPCDLGGIGSPPCDGGDANGVSCIFGCAGENDPIADTEARIGREPLVDCDTPLARLDGECKKKNGKHGEWRLRRNGLVAALVPAVLCSTACDPPVSERVPDAPVPTISATAQGRTVHNPGAAERFVPREGVPDHPIFLFSGVLAAARDAEGRQAVLPPGGDRLLLFDGRGRYVRTAGDGAFVRAIAVTRGAREWLVVERDGGVLSVPLDAPPRPVSNPGSPLSDGSAPPAVHDDIVASPLSHATARNPRGPSIPLATFVRYHDSFIAARSPFASGGVPDASGAPLLLELAPNGMVTAAIDTIVPLDDPTLTTIANAGHLAASDSLFFFASLTRDELRAFDAAGRARWTATRAMTWPRPPSFVPGARAPAGLLYRPVNLAVTTYRSMVYVLAYADSTGQTMRVDAFDEMTGVLRRTVSLPAATMLITLDEKGTLWHAPADTLNVVGAPPGTVVLDFTLPTPRGDTLRLRSFRGKVVLLNIWASWCGPCRDEFPLMAELSRDLPAEDFAVVAVSDDTREADAQRFLAEFNPPFAIAWARGALRRDLAYNGLPFTVLLDREGRVLHRYIGFGGPAQFERLRGDAARALMQSAPSRDDPRVRR